jgi:isoleucyl-tRNA synthetase
MSKRLGNAVDPFQIIADYGVDALRWYMIENAPPWENLKFNEAHLLETQRRFFGTLFNTYSFFALYANVDNFRMQEAQPVPYAERPELDRWILSRLYTLRDEVEKAYENYDPTPAARAIQTFVVDYLSNWYVRLARRRFWKGEMTTDKKAAYETLFETLIVTAQLMAPIAPFISDWLYKNLTDNIRSPAIAQQTLLAPISVHLTDWPLPKPQLQDYELEQRMDWAQEISSLVHSIRKRLKIKVRQPLQKLLIPAYRAGEAEALEKVRQLIEAEVNVKVIELITQSSEILVKKAKPNFKTLGPRFGTKIKFVSAAVAALSTADILNLEANKKITLMIDNQPEEFTIDDFEIKTEDIPGWAVASGKRFTVALDITITDLLKNEGIARDIVNRLQHLRKELSFEVTDKIKVHISRQAAWSEAIATFGDYITAEAQAVTLSESDLLPENGTHFDIEIDGIIGQVMVEKV